MIKDIKNLENILINVYLKNGESFLNKDIPSKVIGESTIVYFWHRDKLVGYALSQVDHWEFVFEN